MGNRAVITTEAGWANKEKNIGVYLHWNGGRDSVQAFLMYCKMQGYRPPESDCYGWASLAKVISNFFGDGLSIGIDTVSRLDTNNGDNGAYIIRNWEIVGRRFFRGNEQRDKDLIGMLEAIDESMPQKEQVGKRKIHEYVLEVGR